MCPVAKLLCWIYKNVIVYGYADGISLKWRSFGYFLLVRCVTKQTMQITERRDISSPSINGQLYNVLIICEFKRFLTSVLLFFVSCQCCVPGIHQYVSKPFTLNHFINYFTSECHFHCNYTLWLLFLLKVWIFRFKCDSFK